MKSINPATGELLNLYTAMTDEQATEVLGLADVAFQEWRQQSFSGRAAVLREMARVLRSNSDSYARLMAEEMGKVVREGVAEIEKCAWVCEYYAEHAQQFLADEKVSTEASDSFISYQPLGVILAVMPWNFPFWQVLRFAAPALMAGNACLLKHASNVSGCALAIESAFREAGLPEHAFRTLLLPSAQVGELIANPLVRAVTLTGSTEAGRAVASKAGEQLKKSVLELGGSDAYLVLEDADVELAAETCVKSRLINAGQSCIAAKRFIVVDAVFEAFREQFLARMEGIRMGNPLDEASDIGPQASETLRNELHKQVLESIEQGASCLLGGRIPEREGAFYPPTVLENVKPGMPAYEQELFGPVAALIRVRDEKEAIGVANSAVFGLGAAVFTRDVERGRRIAREELQAGACAVNDLVKSDPRLPFGGIKQSGFGRELSVFGIREFVNIKAVTVR